MSLECAQCGLCCQADMIAYATNADIDRWRRENRIDILEIIDGMKQMWAGDSIVTRDGKRLRACSFLRWDDDKSYCAIYETRPAVCKNFMPSSSSLCSIS
jgi:Fe-S-cluster containining protein